MLNLFADDMLLFKPITSVSDFRHLQDDIISIKNWTEKNYLSLNAKKCKCMLVSRKRGTRQPLSFNLGGDVLEQVQTFKYLGVLISSSLSWSPHVEAVCTKARKLLGLVYRRFYGLLNTRCMIEIYKTLIRPHLEYAASVWAPHLARDIAKLEGVQKFALRMASHNWSASYQDLLTEFSLPSLERRRYMTRLIFLYKIINDLCYFPSGLISHREPHSYNTRTFHSLSLLQPFTHSKYYLHSFVPKTIADWNSLPSIITFSSSLSSFKSSLLNYITFFILFCFLFFFFGCTLELA